MHVQAPRKRSPRAPLTPEFGSYGMADIVQTRRGMRSCQASEPLEGVRERVGMQEGTVAALTHQCDRRTLVIQRIAPPLSEDGVPLEILSTVAADAVEREGGQQMNHPTNPLGFERG